MSYQSDKEDGAPLGITLERSGSLSEGFGFTLTPLGEGVVHTSENRMARFAALVAGVGGVPNDLDIDRASISELAAHFGVTLRALRFYEQSGLLHPRRRGNQRVYARDDFHRIRLIVALRAYEASIPAIRTILAMIDGRSDDAAVKARIEGLLVALVGDLRDRIADLGRMDRAISTTLSRLDAAG